LCVKITSFFPIDARIVCVADVFKCLFADRAWRKGLAADESMKSVVSMSSKELDPALVELFTKYPGVVSKENTVETKS
jgi:HD-GYP domain-containing protein (c-di-GMP phosphodiesterase class II)